VTVAGGVSRVASVATVMRGQAVIVRRVAFDKVALWDAMKGEH